MNQEEIEKIIVFCSRIEGWALRLHLHSGDVVYDYMKHGGFSNLILKAREKYEDALSAGAVLKIEATPEELGIYPKW